ncbi:hypothetical protein IHE44_0004525, partial [Lamprotornis superbus]
MLVLRSNPQVNASLEAGLGAALTQKPSSSLGKQELQINKCREPAQILLLDDGVDGTVQVDAQAAEEEEPGVQVGRVHEGVHHHQRA